MRAEHVPAGPSKEAEPHLLFVSYHYPPATSAAVYRVTGLIKYLRRMGWRITVLTGARSRCETGDESAGIPPDVSVIRTRAWSPVPEHPSQVGAAGRAAFLVFNAVAYPDRQSAWAPAVAVGILRFLRRHPAAVVISSTPPHSTHLGVRIARTVRAFPWVVDFRDPWTAPEQKRRRTTDRVVRRAMERWVLGASDHVIANTDGNRSALLATFATVDASKVTTVTNAFDDEIVVAPVDPRDPAIACDMLYVGEVYREMLDVYVEAVRQIVQRDPASAPKLHVFGHAGEEDVTRVRDVGLSGHIVFMGTVSYERSIALMRAARSLLLLLPPAPVFATVVPSKLYPYLFSTRPIFAVVPPGDVSAVVEKTGAGEFVAPTDATVVAGRLVSFIERVRGGEARTRVAGPNLERYTMRAIARQVDRVLREVSGHV